MKVLSIDMREITFEKFNNMSENDKKLMYKVEELGRQYFGDMLFAPESKVRDFISIEWEDSGLETIGVPEELEYFTYTWFDFKVEKLQDCMGCFEPVGQTLRIDPEHENNESAILHEMIHLHESVLDSLPSYFKEIVFLTLYWDLRKIIPDLDEILEEFGHLLNENDIYRQGGEHGLLFLLKSFDIDIRKGYPLGTIFGYGKESDFEKYGYITE